MTKFSLQRLSHSEAITAFSLCSDDKFAVGFVNNIELSCETMTKPTTDPTTYLKKYDLCMHVLC